MTKAEVARKLLALGPLTLPQFVEITGWPYRTCVKVLYRLRCAQHVRYVRRGNNHVSSIYEVAR